MILTPHLLAGAAIGSKVNQRRLIFFLIILSLLSHYLLDAIPHLEYDVTGLKNGLNLNFLIAAGKALLDFAVGFFIILYLHRKNRSLFYALFGATVALVPDILIFLSWRINKFAILNKIIDFGTDMHYPGNTITSPIIGVATQIAVTIFAIWYITDKKTPKLMEKSD